MSQHDGIKWLANAHVDKYSPDQVRWATERLGYEPKAAELRILFAEPEDGTADAKGNILVTAGLGNITSLLIGSGGDPFTLARSFVGVGATATAAAVTDVALGANAGSAYYQAFDGAPTRTTVTVTNDTLSALSTFASANGNFAWNEWCWATTTTGAITPGNTLASVTSGTETMVNHKIASLGTKASGASWAFTTTITLA